MMNSLVLALGLVASAAAGGRPPGGPNGPVITSRPNNGGAITSALAELSSAFAAVETASVNVRSGSSGSGSSSGGGSFGFAGSNPWGCGGQNEPACTADNVCGKLNIVFTGLVPTDPQVTAAGFTPAQVAAAMAQDKANIIKAGYNIKAILVGSRNTNALRDVAVELLSNSWAATGVGYGVRGSHDPQLTFFFTDLIKLYRFEAPFAPILFNFSPNTTVVAIEREFPLPSGVSCANHPGKDLGSPSYPNPS